MLLICFNKKKKSCWQEMNLNTHSVFTLGNFCLNENWKRVEIINHRKPNTWLFPLSPLASSWPFKPFQRFQFRLCSKSNNVSAIKEAKTLSKWTAVVYCQLFWPTIHKSLYRTPFSNLSYKTLMKGFARPTIIIRFYIKILILYINIYIKLNQY